ncbi:MAG: AAA family ATPase [Humidesulfovibrio sp.]|nr:AAA family ATPase [Humidesulfovibrio sp.]
MSALVSGPSWMEGKDPSGPVVICGGFADQAQASVVLKAEAHEPGGLRALLPLAVLVRAMHRDKRIVVCSDALGRSSGEATQAAAAIGAALFVPRKADGTACDISELAPDDLRNQFAETLAQAHEPGPANRYQLQPIAELLAQPLNPQWLVKGYLEKVALAVLFGESRSLKSFLALDMGMSIASGHDFHGLAVARGPVVFVAGEGAAGLGRRAQAWAKVNEVDLASVDFHVLGVGVPMLDGDAVDHLVAAIKALPVPPVLVVLDTLSRNFGPGDENSTPDMSAFTQAVDKLRNRFNCAVLVVHHSGISDRNRMRGNYALFAAADTVFKMARQSNTATLTCQKMKDFAEPEPLNFVANAVLLDERDEDGQRLSSLALKLCGAATPAQKPLTGARRIAHEALVAVLQDGRAHIDAWRAEAYRKGISEADTPEARKKAFQAARRALLDAGRIGVSAPYYWPLPGENGKTPGELPAIPTGGSGRCVSKTPPSPPVAPGQERGGELG